MNFLVADVRGALGPYVSVYLVADQHWAVGTVGVVTTLGGWIGLAAQTPLGALLDSTTRKRGLLFVALVVLAAGAVIVALWPQFWWVLIANAGMQIVSGIFQPAVAALTVGLFARRDLTRRMGRNAAFARAGNIAVALLAIGVSRMFSPRAVFLQVPAMVVLAAIAVFTIPHTSIDLRRARGLHPETKDKDKDKEKEASGPVGWKVLLHSRPLLIFGLCSLLFEFADAPLLTLVSQRLAVAHAGSSATMTSACIIASQAGMLPAAMAVGWRADTFGHKRLLMVGFAVVVVQGVLTALSSTNMVWLLALQFAGGVGTGLFSALTPLLLADVMHGTGRYNLSQGAVATMRALGVSSSSLASEFVLGSFGYTAAFLGSAAIAAAALALLFFKMPETRPESTDRD